jgi:phage tail-like protein
MKRKYIWPIIICSVVLISLVLFGNLRLWGQSVNVESLSAVPSGSIYFHLQIDGLGIVEIYNTCSGLGSSNDIDEDAIIAYDDVAIKKIPGMLRWNNITLKRTYPSDTRIWSWRKAMEDGNLNEAIRNGVIAMLRAGSSEPLAQWRFTNGWAASLVFNDSEEELIIVHEGLERFPSSTEVPGVPSRR